MKGRIYMAFSLNSLDVGASVPLEYMPCKAMKPVYGMAMCVAGGMLAAATGTVKPTYISACEKKLPCKAGELIPVIRIGSHQVFRLDSSADLSALAAGDKVALHASNGVDIAATKNEDGHCEIVRVDGKTAFIRFV